MNRPTSKQDAARMRNWGIRNLRALHALAHQLSPVRRRQVCDLIDEELAERGALTTPQLQERTAREAGDLGPNAFAEVAP